jgi:hypothetical protein
MAHEEIHAVDYFLVDVAGLGPHLGQAAKLENSLSICSGH